MDAKGIVQFSQFILNINKKSIWRLQGKVARILVSAYYDSTVMLGENNTIGQIDESKFRKRKYQYGHHVEGVLVVGMIEKTDRKSIILFVVDGRTK